MTAHYCHMITTFPITTVQNHCFVLSLQRAEFTLPTSNITLNQQNLSISIHCSLLSIIQEQNVAFSAETVTSYGMGWYTKLLLSTVPIPAGAWREYLILSVLPAKHRHHPSCGRQSELQSSRFSPYLAYRSLVRTPFSVATYKQNNH